MDKGVHTFPKGISPKTNVTAQLEFGLNYFMAAVQDFSNYQNQTHSEWFASLAC